MDCEHATLWSEQQLVAASWQWLFFLTSGVNLKQCRELDFHKSCHQIRQAEQWLVWVNENQVKAHTYVYKIWCLVASTSTTHKTSPVKWKHVNYKTQTPKKGHECHPSLNPSKAFVTSRRVMLHLTLGNISGLHFLLGREHKDSCLRFSILVKSNFSHL